MPNSLDIKTRMISIVYTYEADCLIIEVYVAYTDVRNII